MVESAAAGASVHKPELPVGYQQEQEPALAPSRVEGEEGEELVSARMQSKRPIKSAPQKRENSWSALAPQYLLLSSSFQCNRG